MVPSKLYTILSAGRPVLAIVPEGSDVAEIVKRHECGIVADPDDPSAVADSVRMLLRNRNLLSEMALRAEKASRGYDRREQTKFFVRMIKETFLGRKDHLRKE